MFIDFEFALLSFGLDIEKELTSEPFLVGELEALAFAMVEGLIW